MRIPAQKKSIAVLPDYQFYLHRTGTKLAVSFDIEVPVIIWVLWNQIK